MPNPDVAPVLNFLLCRSPEAWVEQAIADLDLLLNDHAALELKAAQQAQKLIWKYGLGSTRVSCDLPAAFRSRLVCRMSRLAREELRHFELVVARIERRGGRFEAPSPSRYAAALHESVRRDEPASLQDTLIVGAIIEARSCERFLGLVEPLRQLDADLAEFYGSLLRSEARHFEEYLAFASTAGGADFDGRLQHFLQRDAELITSPDDELRFHSGPLGRAASRQPDRAGAGSSDSGGAAGFSRSSRSPELSAGRSEHG